MSIFFFFFHEHLYVGGFYSPPNSVRLELYLHLLYMGKLILLPKITWQVSVEIGILQTQLCLTPNTEFLLPYIKLSPTSMLRKYQNECNDLRERWGTS